MRESLLEVLRCPACLSEHSLALTAASRGAHEIREGTLRCQGCAAQFEVSEGIVDLLDEPPDYVTREAAGLDRFAALMRSDGWDRERVMQLPYLPGDDYWHGQAVAFERLRDSIAFAPGERLVDIGANTCWASRMFAALGLEVIALDIVKTEMQGLRTAEYFIGDGSMYFERLLSTMAAPALASATLDYVFCCEVLHHNSSRELRRTLRECYRVLRPGGRLLVINEPMRFPLNLKRAHGQEVAQFDGNEHVYFLHQYVLAARRAGFRVRLSIPGSRLRQRARLAWKMAVVGDVPLSMICHKPL